jgi:hypothetical protein
MEKKITRFGMGQTLSGWFWPDWGLSPLSRGVLPPDTMKTIIFVRRDETTKGVLEYLSHDLAFEATGSTTDEVILLRCDDILESAAVGKQDQ